MYKSGPWTPLTFTAKALPTHHHHHQPIACIYHLPNTPHIYCLSLSLSLVRSTTYSLYLLVIMSSVSLPMEAACGLRQTTSQGREDRKAFRWESKIRGRLSWSFSNHVLCHMQALPLQHFPTFNGSSFSSCSFFRFCWSLVTVLRLY